MRKISLLMMALVLAAAAGAEERNTKPPMTPKALQVMKRWELRNHIIGLAPKRRDAPLRYLNISDNEVREIQLVAERYVPKVLVNISPVVTGCPCEDGPQCTEQVFIVAEKPGTSIGLQLSRIKNSWVVGNVQQWFLRYEALRARQREMGYERFNEAEGELLREFPSCVGELVPAENATASTPKVEAKK